MKIRKSAAVVLAAVIAMGTSACGTSENGQGEGNVLKEISVVLDWYPNAIHTFLYEAIDKGYFEEEGLSVNLITPADSVDAISFVANGQAEIGLTYPVETVYAVENGMPVRAIAAVSQKPLDCLCTLADSGITEDMSSVKGKKIGYSGTAVAEATVRTITRNAGLEDGDYELIDVGFDLVSSLTTKSVDMVAGTFINDEVVTMRNNGYDVVVYSEQDYGVPELYGLVMDVNTDEYNEDPEMYQAFLRACKKGFEDMASGEDETMRIIMEEMNSTDNPLDEDQQRESYNILMERMQTDDAEFLSMDEGTWNEIIEWMKDSELITGTYEAEDVAEFID